jgi:RNA polymerase sigma-70 factor, ECF subfamily
MTASHDPTEEGSLRSNGKDEGPTVDPSRFRGPGEPYAGHWREFPAQWPSLETSADEIHSQLAAALARLPGRQRAVIRLRDVEGYRPADVCSILDISASDQRALLHRARAFIRARLDDYLAARRLTRGSDSGTAPT